MDKNQRYSRHCALPPIPRGRVSLVSQSPSGQLAPLPSSQSPVSLKLRYYDDVGNEIPNTAPRVRSSLSRESTFISPRYSSRYLPRAGVEGVSQLFEFGGKANTSENRKHGKLNLQDCYKVRDDRFADNCLMLPNMSPEGLDSSEGSPSSSSEPEMLDVQKGSETLSESISAFPRPRLLSHRLTYGDSPSRVIQSGGFSSYTLSRGRSTVNRYTEGLDWNGGQYAATRTSAERGNVNSYRQTNSTHPPLSQMTCRPMQQRYSKKQSWTQFHSLGSQHEDGFHEVRKHDQKIWPPTLAPPEDPQPRCTLGYCPNEAVSGLPRIRPIARLLPVDDAPCAHGEGKKQNEAVNGDVDSTNCPLPAASNQPQTSCKRKTKGSKKNRKTKKSTKLKSSVPVIDSTTDLTENSVSRPTASELANDEIMKWLPEQIPSSSNSFCYHALEPVHVPQPPEKLPNTCFNKSRPGAFHKTLTIKIQGTESDLHEHDDNSSSDQEKSTPPPPAPPENQQPEGRLHRSTSEPSLASPIRRHFGRLLYPLHIPPCVPEHEEVSTSPGICMQGGNTKKEAIDEVYSGNSSSGITSMTTNSPTTHCSQKQQQNGTEIKSGDATNTGEKQGTVTSYEAAYDHLAEKAHDKQQSKGDMSNEASMASSDQRFNLFKDTATTVIDQESKSDCHQTTIQESPVSINSIPLSTPMASEQISNAITSPANPLQIAGCSSNGHDPTLKLFLRSFPKRRPAVCDEIDKVSGGVKINGVKLSTYDMRLEMLVALDPKRKKKKPLPRLLRSLSLVGN